MSNAFFRYLYRVRKELILAPLFAYLYFYGVCEGIYFPVPRVTLLTGIVPYFTFGLRNKGTVSRRNTYVEGLWRTYEDSTKFDLFTPPVEDLQKKYKNFCKV